MDQHLEGMVGESIIADDRSDIPVKFYCILYHTFSEGTQESPSLQKRVSNYPRRGYVDP